MKKKLPWWKRFLKRLGWPTITPDFENKGIEIEFKPDWFPGDNPKDQK